MLKKIFERLFGLRFYRINKSGAYLPCPPYSYSTYAPWYENDFISLYDRIKKNTVVREDRCYMLAGFARHCGGLEGDAVECGVYKGGTAYLIAKALAGSDKRLRLFDTFSGMPESADNDKSLHKQGDFDDTSLVSVQNFLQEFNNIDFYPGKIPDTFSRLPDNKYCFVHIDLDLYGSTFEACKYFYGRLVRNGIMVVDDYGFPLYAEAAKKAVDDFFADKDEQVISLHTGQCIIIKSNQ